MDFSSYVVPAVAAAVYLICAMIKPFLGEKKKYLPLCAGCLGVLFACWYSMGVSFPVFLSGLASGFGATGFDQAISVGKDKVTVYDPKEEEIE